MPEGQSRFIPSLTTVQKAAESLPAADTADKESMDVVVDKYRSLTFRRLKIKDARGKGYRWVYEGKVSVN
ncbi:MAG: hypothetical protein LR015_03030 [Verrucomicrobia bacterium]|nr:hypothetical protein [Verrucomicrobiota bacterium]